MAATRAYYNENDPYAAQWLKNLIARGLIAPGDVDDRSITEVHPDDLRGYQQCHFFAGIAGWSLALRLAGWPDNRPVWSGSAPCQPFSAAGQQRGFADERHLWPAFFRLISECRPATVIGEQVASGGGLAWLDHVFADLEDADYAVAAADLCAAGIGAPHIRQRLYWVAHAHGGDASPEGLQRGGKHRQQPQDRGAGDLWLADADDAQRRTIHRPHRPDGCDRTNQGREETQRQPGTCREVHSMGEPVCSGLAQRLGLDGIPGQPCGTDPRETLERTGGHLDAWNDIEWIECGDGKARPTQPGIFPLVARLSTGMVRGRHNGVPDVPIDANRSAEARMMRLRGYGNAIVPQLAALFIQATIT